MKSLFSENRLANILSVLRKSSVMSLDSLASLMGVSERTVRNDIKEINSHLKECAVIELEQGKCSLRIFNGRDFQSSYTQLLETQDLMNSSSIRKKYIFGKLMRAFQPVLTDDLAYEMNIGRTTLVTDLNKLRKEIETYKISIVGKTSKGMMLQGNETDIRRYVMNEMFDFIYKEYPMDQEVLSAIDFAFDQNPYEKDVQNSLRKYLTLMLDRFLTGHYVGELPDTYYNLMNHKDFIFVDRLVNRIGNILHVEFPIEEKMYVLLPIIGMRTPTNLNKYSIELDETIRPLADEIIERINESLQISINMEVIGQEFLYHLMFMINRLRFRVAVSNPLIEDIRKKYPLAYNMAKIGGQVVEEKYGVKMSPEELGYLASYFGIYLELSNENNATQRVALICGSGRVTAKLLVVQLQKILDSSAQLDTYSDTEVTPELLNTYDIVLSTVEIPFECNRPILYIHEIFDEADLRKRLQKVRYWHQSDMEMVDDNWYVMADVLEEDTFFILDEYDNYQNALNAMIDQLTEKGYLDN